jgi:hypothetical protein
MSRFYIDDATTHEVARSAALSALDAARALDARSGAGHVRHQLDERA